MNGTAKVLVVMMTGVVLLVTSTAILAEHIPNHEDCDTRFPMPIPGQEHFDGGVLWVTLIGPINDYVITKTTFDITYVSDGATPASDIQLHGTAMVDDGWVPFIVTGADLGFGSGPGTFQGTFETDALNGVAWESFLLPPYSIVDLQIDAVDGGIQGSGYFVDSFITCEVIPAPPCEPPAVCEADLDGDGAVNAADLAQLLGNWGPCEDCPADFNGDGIIDAADLAVLLGTWGPCE